MINSIQRFASEDVRVVFKAPELEAIECAKQVSLVNQSIFLVLFIILLVMKVCSHTEGSRFK